MARAGSVAVGGDRATTAAERPEWRHSEASPRGGLTAPRSGAALPRARRRIERALVRSGDRAEPRRGDRHRRALVRAVDAANAKSCEPEGLQMKCGGTPSAQAC